jgi:hypothetical protein
MKNLFLVVLCVFGTSTIALGQEIINTDELIGYWMPDQTAGQLFFWKDVNGVLQVQEISGTNGEPFIVRDFRINEESIYVKLLLPETNYTTKNYFTLIDNKTLKCEVTGDWTGTLIYSKIK